MKPDETDPNLRAQLMQKAVREGMREANGDVKKVMKETLKEWLDEQFSTFGKWALRGILAMAFTVLVYLVFVKTGWTPPK